MSTTNQGAGAALKAVATDQTPTKATQNPAVEALNKALAGIGQVLPQHITKERMAKLAFGMMRTNAKLASAARRNPASFVNAIMHASKLGLEPGIDAHLVPYENKRQNTVEIQCIPDYRGLLKLARNSGEITSISIQIAYTNDTFDLSLGTEDKMTHKPKLTGDRGEPMLVYAVAKFRDGSHHVEWMSVEDINKIRDGSSGYRIALATAKKYNKEPDSPWINSWEEMARKTLARRISKYLPRSIEIQNAEKLMDAGDKGVPVHFDGEFAVVDEDEAQYQDQQHVPALPEHAGGEPAPVVTQQRQQAAETVTVDEETGEAQLEQHTDAGAPTLDDAIAKVKKGEYDDARAICPAADRQTLEGMIASHQGNGQQPTTRARGR
jgi:recombination protein RecT